MIGRNRVVGIQKERLGEKIVTTRIEMINSLKKNIRYRLTIGDCHVEEPEEEEKPHGTFHLTTHRIRRSSNFLRSFDEVFRGSYQQRSYPNPKLVMRPIKPNAGGCCIRLFLALFSPAEQKSVRPSLLIRY
jgi:hypothetical protein